LHILSVFFEDNIYRSNSVRLHGKNLNNLKLSLLFGLSFFLFYEDNMDNMNNL